MNIYKIFKLSYFQILTAILLTNSVLGQNIDYRIAQKAAQNFLNRSLKSSFNQLKLAKCYTVNKDTVIYVFNSEKEYVIISGSYLIYPVLGYSDEVKFDENNLAPAFVEWIKAYADQISVAKSLKKANYVNPKWKELLSNNYNKSAKTGVAVQPLIKSQWGQAKYYNTYCPEHSEGYNGRCPTGCVATAMGMIMRYYQSPTQGVGYFSYEHPNYGTLSADFGNTIYKWDEMTDVANANSQDAISLLLYHCGVSVSMNYKPKESGSNSYVAALAFVNHFNYRISISYEERNSSKYNDYKWKQLLIDNLEERKPVLYSGSGAYGGHAWICDGYRDTLYFHFNWGWDGANNGYFMIDNLVTNQGDFNSGQSAVVGIAPYLAPYCFQNRVFTEVTKTFTDGSDKSYYWNNTDCDWLIKPSKASKIMLNFDSFNTEEGKDVLNIYNGENSSAPLLGSFSGSELPPVIYANSGTMFLSFSSDGENQNAGWVATYTAIYQNSIEENAIEQTAVVFPNPSNGEINFALFSVSNKATVNIFSTSGQKLYSEVICLNSNIASLNLSFLPKGLYFINLNTGSSQVTKKISIQ